MTNKERICSDCNRTILCHECRHKDVVIPTAERIDIVEYLRLRGKKPLDGHITATK